MIEVVGRFDINAINRIEQVKHGERQMRVTRLGEGLQRRHNLLQRTGDVREGFASIGHGKVSRQQFTAPLIVLISGRAG